MWMVMCSGVASTGKEGHSAPSDSKNTAKNQEKGGKLGERAKHGKINLFQSYASSNNGLAAKTVIQPSEKGV